MRRTASSIRKGVGAGGLHVPREQRERERHFWCPLPSGPGRSLSLDEANKLLHLFIDHSRRKAHLLRPS